MKIALVIEYFDASRGGTEQFTAWLTRELVRAGHEVHVICYSTGCRRFHPFTGCGEQSAAPTAPEPAMKGLHIHALGGPRLSTGVGFRIFGWRAARWCLRHQPDVTHSMTVAFPGELYQPHAGVYSEIQAQAIYSRRRMGGAAWKRLALWLPGKQRTLLALEARATRPYAQGGPMHILSLCPMITRHFGRHYPIDLGPHGPIIELPDPQIRPPLTPDGPSTRDDRAAFRRLHHFGAGDRVAAFVGHDFRRKGLRFAIDAIAKTRRWKLLVVGRGKSREYVEYAASLGIGDSGTDQSRVRFIGPIQDMEKVYAASDALILPTFYDSFGLVAIEALARGLPVISTEYMGVAYLVRDYQAGTIVGSPEETGPMAEALEALPIPGDPAHEQLAARARVAGSVMPPEKYMEALLAIYQQMQRRKHKNGSQFVSNSL